MNIDEFIDNVNFCSIQLALFFKIVLLTGCDIYACDFHKYAKEN